MTTISESQSAGKSDTQAPSPPKLFLLSDQCLIESGNPTWIYPSQLASFAGAGDRKNESGELQAEFRFRLLPQGEILIVDAGPVRGPECDRLIDAIFCGLDGDAASRYAAAFHRAILLNIYNVGTEPTENAEA